MAFYIISTVGWSLPHSIMSSNFRSFQTPPPLLVNNALMVSICLTPSPLVSLRQRLANHPIPIHFKKKPFWVIYLNHGATFIADDLVHTILISSYLQFFRLWKIAFRQENEGEHGRRIQHRLCQLHVIEPCQPHLWRSQRQAGSA